MSAFKFRLQQVLELREQQEKQVAAKLAEAERSPTKRVSRTRRSRRFASVVRRRCAKRTRMSRRSDS